MDDGSSHTAATAISEISPFTDVSVTADATFYRRWQRACPLTASLTLKLPPRASSINVAQLKTLAEIVALPELDRYELHDQIESRESTTDRRLEYLLRQGLIQTPGEKDHYHDRHEFLASDAGIYLIRTWQKDRPIRELIQSFQTAVDLTQGSRESSINVAQLYVLAQVVSGRASTVAELMPLCDQKRNSTQFRLKNLVGRQLLQTDVQFNRGGYRNGTVYAATPSGKELIGALGC